MIFQDEMASYPDDRFRLDRYLGCGIDKVPTMMAKIIKEKYQVLLRSMYQALTALMNPFKC